MKYPKCKSVGKQHKVGKTDPAKFYPDTGMLWWLQSSTETWAGADMGTPADTTAPAAITDLAAETGSTAGSVDLSWTAPGEDGSTGTASSYLVRTSASAILTETDWDNATVVGNGIPTPQAAGAGEQMTVSGLTRGSTFYFAIRAQDEVPNLGGLSNSPSAMAGLLTIHYQYDALLLRCYLAKPAARESND